MHWIRNSLETELTFIAEYNLPKRRYTSIAATPHASPTARSPRIRRQAAIGS
jgi:hypothetical protein